MDSEETRIDEEANTGEDKDIEKLIGEIQTLQEARLKLMADFDNYRKRVELEKSKFGAIANMSIISSILEVIDDIQLALNDEQLDKARAQELLGILQDKLNAALSLNGLEQIEVKKGDTFDPSQMEAITSIDAGADSQHKVVELISSGYQFTTKKELLKPAKVVVGK